jgi:hypothetical protein
MIGKKVRVFWPVDESWYTGTVKQFDAGTGEHLLEYPDGDTEWVKIGEGGKGPSPSQPPPPPPPPPALGSLAQQLPSPYGDFGMLGHLAQHGIDGGDPTMMGLYGGFPSHGYPGGIPAYGHPGMPPQYRPLYPHPAYGGPPTGPPPMMYPPGSAPPVYPGEDKSESTVNEGPNSRRKSGPKAWTKEEDALLLSIVQTMQMPMKWSIVAMSLPDRTGKQCRERYVNHLNPRLKVTDWNALEDSMIFHLYNSIGSHWAKMSKIIPGRTDNGIKNRFHNLRRQYEREDEHRVRLSSSSEFKDAIRLDRLRKFPEHMHGQATSLWDMKSGIGILAAQSIMGGSIGRSKNRFGPFRPARGEFCVRCGLVAPSVQTGDEVCEKSGWCQACTRIPPHISGNLLRECLNLRREQSLELREVVESWVEYFLKEDGDDDDDDKSAGKKEGKQAKEGASEGQEEV